VKVEEATFRRGGMGDIPAIVALQARAWRAAYRGLVNDEYLDALPLQHWIESWRAHLLGGSAATACIVAEDGRGLLGFTSVGGSDPSQLANAVGELHTIYVDPALQGAGLGQRLMVEAIGRLRADGYTDAVLWVLEGNQRARRFYEQAGWSPDGGTGSDEWGPSRVSRVRYRRRL